MVQLKGGYCRGGKVTAVTVRPLEGSKRKQSRFTVNVDAKFCTSSSKRNKKTVPLHLGRQNTTAVHVHAS